MFLVILLAMVALLASLLCFAMGTTLILHLLVRLLRSGYSGSSYWKNVSTMMIVSLVTAAAHLMPIALWALVFLICGEMSTFEKAFYFSAENYTSLGYGDIVLSERWRLLGPLEAVNGLLLFGLSTAVMFAILSRLIASRLHHLGQPGLEALSSEPIRAVGNGDPGGGASSESTSSV
jgi:hypothetical protein